MKQKKNTTPTRFPEESIPYSLLPLFSPANQLLCLHLIVHANYKLQIISVRAFLFFFFFFV